MSFKLISFCSILWNRCCSHNEGPQRSGENWKGMHSELAIVYEVFVLNCCADIFLSSSVPRTERRYFGE